MDTFNEGKLAAPPYTSGGYFNGPGISDYPKSIFNA
jgi:hypothetical protein